METGTALFVLGLLYFAITHRQFRHFLIGFAAFAALAVGLGMYGEHARVEQWVADQQIHSKPVATTKIEPKYEWLTPTLVEEISRTQNDPHGSCSYYC